MTKFKKQIEDTNDVFRTCLQFVWSLCSLAPPQAQPSCFENGYKLCLKYDCKTEK